MVLNAWSVLARLHGERIQLVKNNLEKLDMGIARGASSAGIGMFCKIGLGIGVLIFILKGCNKDAQRRDIEMKGRGMLEAKGIYGELPEGAGEDYYHMGDESSTSSEDYRFFFERVKAYQNGRNELRKRGLSESDLGKVPEYALLKAMYGNSVKEDLDKLAKQYD
jgi:hypothetical protein